jgi:hypothetical protein
MRGTSRSNQRSIAAFGFGITIAVQWCGHLPQAVELVTCPFENPMSSSGDLTARPRNLRKRHGKVSSKENKGLYRGDRQ